MLSERGSYMQKRRASKKQPQEIIESMREMRSKGYPCWYIGRKLDLHSVTVWRYTKEEYVVKSRWTPEEEELLLKLRLQDKIPMEDIAKKLKKSKSACYHKYYVLVNRVKNALEALEAHQKVKDEY